LTWARDRAGFLAERRPQVSSLDSLFSFVLTRIGEETRFSAQKSHAKSPELGMWAWLNSVRNGADRSLRRRTEQHDAKEGVYLKGSLGVETIHRSWS
jgi:hypothetical protein